MSKMIADFSSIRYTVSKLDREIKRLQVQQRETTDTGANTYTNGSLIFEGQKKSCGTLALGELDNAPLRGR